MSAADRIGRCYRIAGGLIAEFVYEPRLPEPLRVAWKPQRPEKLKGAARRRYEVSRSEFTRLIAKQREGRGNLGILETFDMSDELAADLKLRFARAGGSA